MDRLPVFGKRPVPPMPAPGLRAFEAALSRGEPEMMQCSACGKGHLPGPMACACGASDFRAVPLPATGSLFAATTIHVAPGALAHRAPYRVGLVDLDSGPRLLLQLFGPVGWQAECDRPVCLFIADFEDGPVLAAHPAGTALSDLIHSPPEAVMTQSTRPDTTRVLIARQGGNGPQTGFESIPLSDLPEGDVLVRVEYSGINYKDALAITGKAPIVRTWPMVLGIDLAGEVVDSRTPRFRPGDAVIANGFGLSETRWGGYSHYQSLPEGVLLHRPEAFTAEQAMQIGTAGYTAMLCVMALTDHGLEPGRDAVLVTGATGGVGSVAVSLLSKAGFDVIGVTGRPEQVDFVKRLGARDVISRDDLATGGKALARERWAGAVDVAGGEMLSQVIAQTSYDGIVATCGMAGGGDLPATVYPFILRGVTLRGVDSVMVPLERRQRAWDRLAAELDVGLLAQLSDTRRFEDVKELASALLNGRLHGRIALRIAEGGPTGSP